jgi:mannose-6-phosphate isomerase-like protein (cupin superfamily)
MHTPPMPTIRPLNEAEPYEQEEPGEAWFRRLMSRDEIPGMAMGHVHLKGPIHKTPGAHDDFHQTYFIYEGSATIHLADRAQAVEAPTLVMIPRNTTHSVQVAEGKQLRYVFVNQYQLNHRA